MEKKKRWYECRTCLQDILKAERLECHGQVQKKINKCDYARSLKKNIGLFYYYYHEKVHKVQGKIDVEGWIYQIGTAQANIKLDMHVENKKSTGGINGVFNQQ